MDTPLFNQDEELNHELCLLETKSSTNIVRKLKRTTTSPATGPTTADLSLRHITSSDLATSQNHVEVEQERPDSSFQTLPGQPRVPLLDERVVEHLKREFSTATRDLDEMPLWLMTTPHHDNIYPLTYQVVKGREIVVTEHLRLHLVWGYNQIFVKPLPRYLLSFAFWQYYICNGSNRLRDPEWAKIRGSALGFLRTYYYLIQHESDFWMARDEKYRLIPEDVDWDSFSRFISHFEELRDGNIPNRFRSYGQISLFRLNIWYYVFHPFAYQSFHSAGRKWGVRAQFFLFCFAVATVVCSAMQSAAAVQLILGDTLWPWYNIGVLWIATRGFSVACIVLFTSIAAFWLIFLALKLLRQLVYTVWSISKANWNGRVVLASQAAAV